MARKLSSAAAEFETDFAILEANQEGYGGACGGTFVRSFAGTIGGTCGTKYSKVSVVAERWDARPPYQSGWEDLDEVPFEEAPGAGPLVLQGFEPTEGALDVDGLGRARAVVYARGRHRYFYGDYVEDDLPPEEWLIQLWPDSERLDALAGDPRRLAAPDPHAFRTAWWSAVHAWEQTGWNNFVGGPGCHELKLAIAHAAQPVTALALAAKAPYYTQYGERGAPDPLGVPLGPDTHGRLARLAAQAGMAQIEVFADLILALQKIGLLLSFERGGEELLVPNPAPGMVWDTVDMTDDVRRGYETQIGYADFRTAADDMQHVLHWAPDRKVVGTPRMIALRLALAPEHVLGAMRLLTLTAHAVLRTVGEAADNPVDALMEITLPELTQRQG